MLATNPAFFERVNELGVSQLRYTERNGETDSVVLFVPEGTGKERIVEIARRANAAWPDVLVSILEERQGMLCEVWASDLGDPASDDRHEPGRALRRRARGRGGALI